MNWTVFFSILIVVPVGMAFCFGLVALAIWLDETLGGYWGGAICFGLLILALATLLGWAAK